MLDAPFFEDDIFINIYSRLIAYVLSGPFSWIFPLIIFLGGVLIYCLKKDFGNKYDYLFQLSSIQKSEQKIGLIPLITFLSSFLLYILVLFRLEVGIFSNNDLMFSHFLTGTWQQYGYVNRFNPLVFLDLTILYGITHNFIIINLYNIAINLLLFFLIYRLFDMFSATKRLVILAVLIFFPAYFSTWSIIFTEKQSIIFVLASLLCLKNWIKNKNSLWIWFFFIWMNIACYVKETNVVFYFFIFVGLFLISIWKGCFTFSSFYHPFKTIKSMPLEFLIGLSILIFAVQYMIVIQGVKTNTYLNAGRVGGIDDIITLYWFEFVIMGCSLISFIKSAARNPLINLLYFSACVTIVYITGYLQIIPTNDLANRPYYIALAASFMLICWLGHLQPKTFFYITAFLIITGSLILDYQFVQNYESRERKELAEFIARTNNRAIVFGESFNYKRVSLFWCASWPRAFKQSFPGKNIYFKFFGHPLVLQETIYHYALVNEKPVYPHDYYIILKKRNGKATNIFKDMQILSKYKTKKVFENDFYQVYLILETNHENEILSPEKYQKYISV